MRKYTVLSAYTLCFGRLVYLLVQSSRLACVKCVADHFPLCMCLIMTGYFCLNKCRHQIPFHQGSEEEKPCFRISDKDGKLGLLRDVSPSQGLLQSAKWAKRLSTIPISRFCLMFLSINNRQFPKYSPRKILYMFEWRLPCPDCLQAVPYLWRPTTREEKLH